MLDSDKGKEKPEEIRQVETTLIEWKANLRRQKKRDVLRLEATSDKLPPLASLNSIMDCPEIPRIFHDGAAKGFTISNADIQFAVAALSIPIMLASSVRPGLVP